MPRTATTAKEALDRYEAYRAADALIQKNWHSRSEDGRELACALSVIDPDMSSVRQCPAQIMPRWLALLVPWLFDNQTKADALDWGSRFYCELARLDGRVPFSVVHDWHGNVVGALAVERSAKRGSKVETHEALRAMHAEVLTGKSFTADEWSPVLKAAFIDSAAFSSANANDNAFASALASADASASANAYAYACANEDADEVTIKRLADGLVDCLARVPTGQAA